jgi:glycerol-3-phosphate cytidylyltransferase
LFHPGHVQLLAACRKIAGTDGKVVVALNTDEFIERFKNRLPVMSYAEREVVLQACRFVDDVIPNIGEEDSKKTIVSYGQVDIVAIGSDWAPPRDYYAQMGFTPEWLNDRQITLVFVDRNTSMSTTLIKSRMKANQQS